jgi:hypothetical protein
MSERRPRTPVTDLPSPASRGDGLAGGPTSTGGLTP